MDELTGVFVQESREQLAEMEAGLLALEADPEDASDINAIFRAAHTIKGGAGVVECVFLEGFTHKVENLLDQLRDGRLNPTEARISLLLDCADHIGQLLLSQLFLMIFHVKHRNRIKIVAEFAVGPRGWQTENILTGNHIGGG